MRRGFVSYLRVSTNKQGPLGLGIQAQRKSVEENGGRWELLAEFVKVEEARRRSEARGGDGVLSAPQRHAGDREALASLATSTSYWAHPKTGRCVSRLLVLHPEHAGGDCNRAPGGSRAGELNRSGLRLDRCRVGSRSAEASRLYNVAPASRLAGMQESGGDERRRAHALEGPAGAAREQHLEKLHAGMRAGPPGEEHGFTRSQAPLWFGPQTCRWVWRCARRLLSEDEGHRGEEHRQLEAEARPRSRLRSATASVASAARRMRMSCSALGGSGACQASQRLKAQPLASSSRTSRCCRLPPAGRPARGERAARPKPRSGRGCCRGGSRSGPPRPSGSRARRARPGLDRARPRPRSARSRGARASR